MQGTDLCALGVLCERKMSHAESAEIAEACGFGCLGLWDVEGYCSGLQMGIVVECTRFAKGSQVTEV